jgi:hypothetical protein
MVSGRKARGTPLIILGPHKLGPFEPERPLPSSPVAKGATTLAWALKVSGTEIARPLELGGAFRVWGVRTRRTENLCPTFPHPWSGSGEGDCLSWAREMSQGGAGKGSKF